MSSSNTSPARHFSTKLFALSDIYYPPPHCGFDHLARYGVEDTNMFPPAVVGFNVAMKVIPLVEPLTILRPPSLPPSECPYRDQIIEEARVRPRYPHRPTFL